MKYKHVKHAHAVLAPAVSLLLLALFDPLLTTAVTRQYHAEKTAPATTAIQTISDPEQLAQAALQLKSFLYAQPPSTSGTGLRGIVISAGGQHLLSNAYVTAKTVRHYFHSKLPIFIGYCGPEELDTRLADKLKALHGVTLRDVCSRGLFPPHQYYPEEKQGWVKKLFAIYFANEFDEFLFLDADNQPLINPETLFSQPAYLSHGSLFWPDYQRAFEEVAPSPKAYEYFGLEPPWQNNSQWMTTESGQFLFDRKRHGDVLEFIMFLNVHSRVMYEVMFGDKDTFELAFMLAGKLDNFKKVPCWVRNALSQRKEDRQWHHLGHVQNDADGYPLFLHRTDAKLDGGDRDVNIVYITTPIGPDSFKRYHYIPSGARVLDESSAHDHLNCTDMDKKTVAILHTVNSTWSPGCTGQVQLADGPIYLVPRNMFGYRIVDAINYGYRVFQTLLAAP